MSAEQRLLDVIADTQTMPHGYALGIDGARQALAALREAIADNPTLGLALIPEGPPLTPEQESEHAESVARFDRIVKLGRAVEATHQRERGWLANGVVIPGWNDCLNAIYTAADVERSS